MATAAARDLERWRQLIRAEFCELPGMRLTLQQARRLWDLDAETCREALEALVEQGFLVRVEDQFCRADGLDGA